MSWGGHSRHLFSDSELISLNQASQSSQQYKQTKGPATPSCCCRERGARLWLRLLTWQPGSSTSGLKAGAGAWSGGTACAEILDTWELRLLS